MNQIIRGKAFVAGDNIDTDQIIPAEYLSYNPSDPAERKFFGKHAMCGVPIEQSGLPGGHVPFVKEGEMGSEFAVIIGGRNFGCGSSREHAPLAIAEAGCKVVIAQSYARIFYRNSINGAYLVPLETAERLVDKVSTGDEVEVDLAAGTLKDLTTDQTFPLEPLGDVQAIIEAGGIFEYARRSSIQ
ncbi:MAG: 2,3-dimethylmalate dehydratase small subunit [Planctomycetes bacterium ADurb.Bin126]|nr:MAG: 2,3-dimethylmalate dehydratase small subunit [Planctomycetes bacterium ADurb.Bin126]HOD80388.1 3-isopropylmalate dehydratase [Phycisphaerae bacterium]HQL74419.1 3-isopropylmalate dehydratase [Phycisphaerae bacterium]